MTIPSKLNGVVSERTLVDLTWREGRIEHRIRFGSVAETHILDRHRRVVGFDADTIFGYVRWAANEHGTIISRIDIVRAVAPGEAYQTLPFVRPGGEILLRISGWTKVERVLAAIDAIEMLGIDPVEVAPEHWRHMHNRIAVNEPFRLYLPSQHGAWLKRRSVL